MRTAANKEHHVADVAHADADSAASTPNMEEIRSIIESYIMPLLPGSTLAGPEKGANTAQDLVTFDTGNRLRIAVPNSGGTHFILKRFAPFTDEERDLLLRIAENMHADFRHRTVPCHLMLCDAVERAIASAILPSDAATAYGVIQVYNQWAAETCEGRRVPHTVGLCPAQGKTGSETFLTLQKSGHLKKLGSGDDILLTLGNGGTLLGVENIPSKLTTYRNNEETLAPVTMHGTALWAGSGGRVALRLTEDGEILVFKNKMLMFAKRRSHWRSFPHKRLLDLLLSGNGNSEEERNRLALYRTLLDLAFSRYGGCIGVLREGAEQRNVFDLVAPEALFSFVNPPQMTAMFKTVVNSRKFYEIPRKVRVNLCAVDGALLMDSVGTILAAGTIVKTDGSPGAGGRTAAALSMARYGYGVKVSDDGYVEMYHEGKPLGGFA